MDERCVALAPLLQEDAPAVSLVVERSERQIQWLQHCQTKDFDGGGRKLESLLGASLAMGRSS
jgi:hypothetical protein